MIASEDDILLLSHFREESVVFISQIKIKILFIYANLSSQITSFCVEKKKATQNISIKTIITIRFKYHVIKNHK